MTRPLIFLLAIASVSITNNTYALESGNKLEIKKTNTVANLAAKNTRNEIIVSPNSPQLVNMKIETIQEIFAPSTDPLNGKITFDENFTTRIGTPIDGRVTKINVQIGDSVKAGQVLMLIDAPDLGNALSDARKAQLDLQLKKQANQRNHMLFDNGVIAKKELENSDADFAQAEAEMARTKSKLKNLGSSNKVIGENYAVRSPISGVIVDRQANPGSLIRADALNPIFIITNPDHLWASIDLPERDLGKIFKNQNISVEVDAYPNEIFSGRVQSIGQMVDPATRRIQIRCMVDGKGKLKPEMYAKITPLNSSKDKVLRLPNSALITDGLYSYVFVETSAGHLAKTKVNLSAQQLNFSIVKDGLKAGDRIVTSGAILLNSELAADH